MLRLECAPKERLIVAMHDTDIVERLCSTLSERIGCDRFDLWFAKLSRLEATNDKVLVVAQSSFVRDWIRSHLGQELRAAIQTVLQDAHAVELHFTLSESGVGDLDGAARRPCGGADLKIGNSFAGAASGTRLTQSSAPAAKSSSALSSPFPSRGSPTAPLAHQPSASSRPGRRFESFEAFVVGEENRSAMAAARLVTEQPGQASPLLIHGPTATGKTHLLEGIRTQVRHLHSQCRVLCLTAEQFTSGYVEAARRRELPSFRGKYRFVDYLLLDDIHFLAGKTGTVGELLYTVEALQQAGRQVVMTSDRPPAELGELGEELLSRISAGLVTEIALPGYGIRLGIAARTARRLGLRLTPEMLSAIAMQVTSHGRAVIGAVNRLYAQSLNSERPLVREEVDALLAEIAQQHTPSVRLADIERAVCDLFAVDAKTLRSARRARTVSDPRTLAMWLARKYTRAALGEIGTYFGRRSHSTVISASRKVERWLCTRSQIVVGKHHCTADEAIRRIEQALRRA
jgi:chromosomal replication initiator protein